MTNLEWSIQFVLLKIQEMVSNITESLQKVSRLKPVASKIFHGRKTEQCGVILFGTEETHNLINEANGGYDHVTEYIPIAQPNVNTLTKLQQLRPSEDCVGDRKLSSEIQNNSCLKLISKLLMQSLLALRTQDKYLLKKRDVDSQMVVLTDGESPIVLEDWELTAKKIKSLSVITTIMLETPLFWL